jgi:hypothetical protein
MSAAAIVGSILATVTSRQAARDKAAVTASHQEKLD